MNIPCVFSTPCNPPGGYPPYTNVSAESPDFDNFFGYGYGNPQLDPPLGSHWQSWSCLGECTSTTSQADADQCAANNQLECILGGGNGGGAGGNSPTNGAPPTNPSTGQPYSAYDSGTQIAFATCPDGSQNLVTLPAGYVKAMSLATANNQAGSEANKLAAQQLICLGDLPGSACLGGVYDEIVPVTAGPGVRRPLSFAGAGFPKGINVSSADPAFKDSASVFGAPTETGAFTGSIVVTGANGVTATKKYPFNVLGITNTSLPGGQIGSSYSAQLIANGGTPPYVFGGDSQKPFPTGIVLSPLSGALSGTPTQLGTFNVGVTVTDDGGKGKQCPANFEITITGIGNDALTAVCSGDTEYQATVPANSYGVPPSTPNGKGIANSKANADATNQIAAQGCNCATTNNRQSDYNASSATMSQASGLTAPSSPSCYPITCVLTEYLAGNYNFNTHAGTPNSQGGTSITLTANQAYTLFQLYNIAYGSVLGPGSNRTYTLTAGGGLVGVWST